MPDVFAQHVAKIRATAKRLDENLTRIRESADVTRRFSKELASFVVTKPIFEKLLLQDRATTYFAKVGAQIEEGLKKHREAHIVVSAALPRRGWYLSGQEPATLSLSLAASIREGQWYLVDKEVMQHMPEFKADVLTQWLAENGVPDYCIDRVCRFIRHHDAGSHEEATYLGVPLIDEIAGYLYDGKAFTTKRGNRRRGGPSKPEIAIKTVGAPDLEIYCKDFVDTFGSLQEDPAIGELNDENYWNRHAIVHGMMRRAMGIKDSAKCLMAINFLIFARKEDKTSSDVHEPK